MSYPSHTCINVAKNTGMKLAGGIDQYIHFFRVIIEARPEDIEVSEPLKAIQKAFKAPSFEVSVTYWKCSGTPVEP